MIRQTVPRIREMLEQARAYGELVKRSQRKGRKNMLIYDGSVYVRPVGRGIVLEDELGKPHLDEWIEAWLMKSAPHRSMTGNFFARLDIVIRDVSKTPGTVD